MKESGPERHRYGLYETEIQRLFRIVGIRGICMYGEEGRCASCRAEPELVRLIARL